jgi:hypothetical protein
MTSTTEERASRSSAPASISEVVVDFLSQSKSYGEESSEPVQRLETHISWIFLTDNFAYKLKKPVRFDFLDFRDPDLRRDACRQEVLLNRRLAPDVYIGVIPITYDDRRLSLGGRGRPIDWVVKMRRLPSDCALDRLLAAGSVGDEAIESISKKLLEFYRRLPRIWLPQDEYLSRFEHHVRDNRRDLLLPQHPFDPVAVKRVHGQQLRFLKVHAQELGRRIDDGRIVEGHGDLRPEHIYLIPSLAVIDCIEFQQEYRQLDVLDEFCFLTMECAFLQAESFGQKILRRYLDQTQDPAPTMLADFYCSYRACVRAKVLALRADQQSGLDSSRSRSAAKEYLRLADNFAGELDRPLAMVVRGVTGSGKSTLARALADDLGMELLRTDGIRRELFGDSRQHFDYGQGVYRPERRMAVYAEMLRRADNLLRQGLSVILDGAFGQANCTEVNALAAKHGARSFVVECFCSDDVARERMALRMAAGDSDSDARPELYDRLKSEQQDRFHLPADCRLETTRAVHELVAGVVENVKKKLY